MHQIWAVLIVVVSAIGLLFSFSPKFNRFTRFISAISVLVSILIIFGHNVYWEKVLNPAASKGWTLLYTLPPFAICLGAYILLAGYTGFNYIKKDRTEEKRSPMP